MLHPTIRRAVTGAAVASLAGTLLLAAPGAAQGEAPSETGPSPAGSESQIDGATDALEPAPRGTRIRLRVRNQDVRGLRTTRTWARKVLVDEGVRFDDNDLVRVRRDGNLVRGSEKRKLRAGDAVQLVAVDRVVKKRRTMIERPTRTRTVSRLRAGQRKVVAKGRPGVRTTTIVKTRHNRSVVDVERTRQVTRSAKPRKVLVGADPHSVPGTAHLNWRALANCESGGNPRAVNPAGYHGLYQFDSGTWRSVGGSGVASRASAGEQTYRAKLLYKQRGRSPWPHCGRYL
ncbi:resuscitation-promoting factor [Nocardioides sp.]|uniref:resuscitation-promoting factor n=1 Tax=Nocardioides sp. TaxID=35761 RepID=UPI002B278B60|nr:resuscitation-promoting factor [Nocardioides sp.]